MRCEQQIPQHQSLLFPHWASHHADAKCTAMKLETRHLISASVGISGVDSASLQGAPCLANWLVIVVQWDCIVI